MGKSGSILVLGESGLIGSALMELFSGEKIHGRDKPTCDVTNPDEVLSVLEELNPSAVINATGFTNVDECESEPEKAFELNSKAPETLARACRRFDCLLVHLSTDFVFDGLLQRPYRENDPTNPISAYGRTKLAGEEAVKKEGKDWLMVRTSWVFGHQGRDFVRTILKLAGQNNELNVVDDQTGCPTYSLDIARGIMKLIEVGARGIFHMVNAGQTTWFGLAKRALSISGFNDVTINPITSQQLARPAQRPAYSVLDTSLFQNTTGIKLRSWEEALDAFLKRGDVRS